MMLGGNVMIHNRCSRWRKRLGVISTVAMLCLGAASCGLSSTKAASGPSPKAASGPSPAATDRPATSALVSSLSPTIRAYYKGTPDNIHQSPYETFAAEKHPWKLCFEDSYEGNAFRVAVRVQLARLAAQFHQQGLVSSFKYAVSDSSPTTENSQLHTFIDDGCSLILLTAGSSTSDNASIADAYHAHIPVVAFDDYVSSPYAEVVDQPFYQWGQEMAQNIANRLHGHGTVIMLQGIAGESVAVEENDGAQSVWSRYPGLTVLRTYGDWTPSTTSSAIVSELGTHPGPIAAVWTTGSEAWYVEQAFAKSGRPIPYITSSPAANTLALIHTDPGKYGAKFFGNASVPVPVADMAFDTAVRILSGQGPKLSPLMLSLPSWSGTSLAGWYASCMAQDSEAPFPIPPAPPVTTSQMNAYFEHGVVVHPYSYSSTLPNLCG